MHAHSILWFAGVVFLLALVYRQMLPVPAVAVLAVMLYVIDDNNYFPDLAPMALENAGHGRVFDLFPSRSGAVGFLARPFLESRN
ncbi:MAG: hypothetical protein GY809_09530 [Planctomycetes bacterium]|nr:hypothetical protein [Planctomycetota bacterium]